MKLSKIGLTAILTVSILFCVTYFVAKSKIDKLRIQNDLTIRYFEKTIASLLNSNALYNGLYVMPTHLNSIQGNIEKQIYVWYPKTMCESCFSSRLDILSEYLCARKDVYAILLTNSNSLREMKSISNSHNLRCEIIQIPEESKLDTVTKPMMFKLSNGAIVNSVYLNSVTNIVLDAFFSN